ncbi:hypothetical protein M0805_007552 [Coniferiporia weirii]|nr:hypothetical protein M0805_007552 [Coniferiporia weirii]
MQSLLRWSIENSQVQDKPDGDDVNQQPPEPRQFDPELINALIGRPESELMMDALTVATDVGKSEDARLGALDDFEMLVENIDNANNIENMGMWSALRDLLTSPESSDDVRAAVLWIVGTAAQNNPAAQNAYLSLPDSPLLIILDHLAPGESSSKTRSKAVYALSGLLKHNARGVTLLEECGGWKVLKSALEDPDIAVRRKTVFFLNSLLVPSTSSRPSAPSAEPSGIQMHGANLPNNDEPRQPEYPNSHAGMTLESTTTSTTASAALKNYGITSDLVRGLVNPLPHGKNGDEEGDVDLEEKLVRLLHTYLILAGGQLDDDERRTLSSWIQMQRGKGVNWELESEELDALQDVLNQGS